MSAKKETPAITIGASVRQAVPPPPTMVITDVAVDKVALENDPLHPITLLHCEWEGPELAEQIEAHTPSPDGISINKLDGTTEHCGHDPLPEGALERHAKWFRLDEIEWVANAPKKVDPVE